jgi:N-acetylglutamate synthase-like GNAT family acetyltransferase
MSLLLLADESIEAIERYIHQCDVYVLVGDDGQPVGVVALHHNSPEELEVKNIAITGAYQGKGLGSFMLSVIERIAADAGYRRILVGTATVGRQLDFYRKNGYLTCGLRRNFFLENYPDPIFEDGERLCDMVLLEKNI